MSALDIPGFSALQCVISSLRDTAHFTDEEGDLTDKLRDLRDWVSIRAAVQAAQPEAVGEPWGVDANKLLSNAMKPSEIAGPADVQRRRVSELLSWFARLADGQANPKWTTEHAFELAYYIASAPTPEPMSAPTEAKPAQQDAVDAERWRWAMTNWTTFMKLAMRADDLTVAIDAAISAKKGGA